MSMYEQTAERLGAYHAFDQDIIDEVSMLAEIQSALDHDEFMEMYGIPEAEVFEPVGGKPVKILDIKPQGDYDTDKARVMHIAMANDLDPNQIYQMATIFVSDPTTRLITVGNPSAPGRNHGRLSLADAKAVAKGDLRPVIDPVMQYVANEKISQVEHVGYSFGSTRATAAMKYAENYDHQGDGVAIEPADVKNRGRKLPALLKLAGDFASTGKALDDYVNASDVDAFNEARKNSPGLLTYSLGLARVTNLAISSTLAGNHYERRASEALDAQPEHKLHTIWGSESELAIDGLLQQIVDSLQAKYGERAPATRLEGQKHAMVNDIHLQAAIVRQGYRA